MSKQADQAVAMGDAMEIACQVLISYGEEASPYVWANIAARNLHYDHPVFQAAYAAVCLERDLPNQYITIDMG